MGKKILMNEGIKEIQSRGWLYLENTSAGKVVSGDAITGKYLFFSDDKKLLIETAKEILLKYNLLYAKVPLSDNPNPSHGFGFVLCIYDISPKLKYELKHFADEKTVKYGFWKSDASTLDGQYSEEFLNSIKNRSRLNV